MDGEAKALLQLSLHLAGTPIGPLASTLLDMRQNLRGQLMSLLGSAPLRQQTSQSTRGKRRVRLVGGWQRHTEQLRGGGD